MLRMVAVAIFGLVSTAAIGQPTFSIDFQGPIAGAPGPGAGLPDGFGAPLGIDEGQILTQSLPGPPGPNPPVFGPSPPPGIMVDSVPGSPFGTAPGGLGILPGILGAVELDALSYGRDHGLQLFFSVDEFAAGDPLLPSVFPDVSTEGVLGAAEASADVFTYLAPAFPVPIPGPIPGIGPGNTDVIDGDGLFPFGGPGLGLIEPNPPIPGTPFDPGDNLDALDIDTTLADVFGPIYFSLDSAFPDPLEGPPANSGTAVGNMFVGGDVLVSFAGGLPGLYAPAPILGLDLAAGIADSDDLDALILFEDGDGVFTPLDFILFSVRRGSAVIGALDSLNGAPIEEGDILTIPFLGPGAFSPFPAIFIPAEALGLGTIRSGTAGPFGFGDELDALDVVPEPATCMLLLIGLGAFLTTRRTAC